MRKSIVYSFILLLTTLFTVSTQFSHAQKQKITAQEVISLIQKEVNCGWNARTVDTFKAGDPKIEVTGIATTFMATIEVLKKAKAQGCNLIITHEPTFFNHFDNMELLEDDPVQQTKLKFIEENNLVIFRFHDHLHRHQPDGIYMGMVKAFGWEAYREGTENKFNIPKTTLKELATFIADKFQTGIVRVVGNPDMELTHVGMVLGAAGSQSHFNMLHEKDMQAIIVGESQEWEAVEYIRDANELGMPKGFIVMGHADSEEAGMEYCAEWLKGFIPNNIPIKFIPAGNPLWSPNLMK